MIDRSPRVESWMVSLLDLSASNRLLHLAESRTLLPLPGADPVKVALTLAGGGAFAFEAGCDPAVETGWLRVPLTTPELEHALTIMRRRARTELAERGVHILWLGLGTLTWCDAGGAVHTAPLALWPAELERATGAGLRLVGREGIEPRINLLLVEKLQREFGVVLAVPGDDDPEVSLDLLGLLDAAEGIAVTRPGWKVERTAHLGLFSLEAQTIWRDLEAAATPESPLLASPVLAHLSRADAAPFGQPSIAAAEAVTRPRPVAEVVAPLDADGSQLAAVAAAAAGASFVLEAAPGTGASQTIANLIAHCISDGKTVLFVSEQLGALDVVRERLSQVGLGEFCLPVSSSSTTRSSIVAQLGRVFDRSFRPGTGPSGDDARLAELRSALDVYVAALHKSGPFGRSVHEVLGRLVELRTTPRADLAERDAVGLDRATFDRRKLAVTALAEAALPVEPVATHPWRASTLERLPEGGSASAIAALDEASRAATALADAVREVSSLVPHLVTRTRDQLVALGALASLAAGSSRPGAEMLTHIKSGRGDDVGEKIALIRARGTGTIEVPRDPLAFLQLSHRHRALVTEVEDGFTDAVEALDAPALWAQLRKWTTSMGPLRYVALRAARAEIKAAAMPAQLETDGAMISALEAVMAERACRAALLGAAEPARRWFGELGGDPLALDLGKLDAAVGWAAELRKAFDAVDLTETTLGTQREHLRAAAWRGLVAQVAAGPSASAADLAPFARLAEAVARWLPALATLATTIGIDAVTLGAGDDHLTALRERVETLRLAVDSLREWVAFHTARHGALAAGVGPAVGAIERGDLGAAELADAWERATLLAWGDAELTDTPALAQFHGASHHAQVSAFADLDRGALALSRARALVRLADRVPRIAGKLDAASKDPVTVELRILMQELERPRGHRSLRTLFAELPTILPRLAPCLMMTPAGVSQYLDPASSRFDVVVFDEASRIPTAMAIGALGRATSAVIVGDSQQLPPSDGSTSLLADCLAAKLPVLSLTWHYRSKHEDVIAFANQRYYGDRLQVFPAAQSSPDLGVAWRRIDGAFDREGSGANRIEAEAVVAEAIARLRDPNQRTRSLGIITGCVAQQELIEDLLDAALLGEPSGPVAAQPLMIKELGALRDDDDRDVILLSIGYGPALDGVMTMNLGALSEPHGPRALAAALTRAREQLLVFSSFAPEDLHDDAAPAVRDLAAFLTFARAGGGAGRPAETVAPASPITAAIARTLAERGWAVRHQVGCGAYKLDLAVIDPSDPERYVLAIEHDGLAYAAAPVARDRDRLRGQVLAQLGWRLHRIWGLDWWADPEREIQRAHGAIVTAIAANRQRRAPVAPPKARAARASSQLLVATGSAPAVKIPARGEPVIAAGSGPTEATPLAAYEGNTTPTRIKRGTIAIGPYTAAAIPNGRRTPDDLFAPRHLAELGKVVEQVLAAEAPMHVDLLARRVGGYFGIGRVTQRVTDQVRVALSGRGRWGEEQDVVWRLDQDPDGVPPVRVAGQGPTAKRDIGEVPLSELASAARIVVERASGIAPNDLVRDAARLLGFARITEQVVERVTLAVRLAAARELIQINDNKAKLPD